MRKTERLILQQPDKGDLNIFFEINRNPRNNLFNPSGPVSFIEIASEILDEVIAHWKTHGFGSWKISTSEGNVIGFGGLNYKKYGTEENLNLGYRLDEQYWGKGYATELAEYAIHYGINEWGKDEVFGLVRPDHTASIRVLEKCGMVRYGELDDVPGQDKSLIFIYRKS